MARPRSGKMPSVISLVKPICASSPRDERAAGAKREISLSAELLGAKLGRPRPATSSAISPAPGNVPMIFDKVAIGFNRPVVTGLAFPSVTARCSRCGRANGDAGERFVPRKQQPGLGRSRDGGTLSDYRTDCFIVILFTLLVLDYILLFF